MQLGNGKIQLTPLHRIWRELESIRKKAVALEFHGNLATFDSEESAVVSDCSFWESIVKIHVINVRREKISDSGKW